LGLHFVRHAVVVVEGYFDAVRIGPGAVPTMGVSFTKAQINLLSKIPVRVVLYDNESVAQRRASELADLLAPYPGETHVATLSGPDPDTSPPEEIQELRHRFLV
jgi:DNA primase